MNNTLALVPEAMENGGEKEKILQGKALEKEQKKAERKKELYELLNLLEKRGYFSEKEKSEAVQGLESKDVQVLTTLWLAMQPPGYVADLESGIITGIATGVLYGWPVGLAVGATITAVGTVINNRMAHYMGKGLPNHERLKKLVMIPQIGKHMPLILLLKDYKGYMKLLWVYSKVKKFHAQKSLIEDKKSIEYQAIELKELETIEKAMKSLEKIKRRLERWRGRLQRFFKDIKDLTIRARDAVSSVFKPKPGSPEGISPALAPA